MLFNSYPFLVAFLPAVLLAFHLGRRVTRRLALGVVSVLSLLFYGLWDPRYLALLVPSLVINYALGEILAETRQRAWLIAGIAANLAVIGWFKYSAFFYVAATGIAPPDFMRGIVLPLGISFITFQKIAYLVDIWRGYPKAASFDRFAFFVLFFPQLIAGPIVLFRNIDRQIRRDRHQGSLMCVVVSPGRDLVRDRPVQEGRARGFAGTVGRHDLPVRRPSGSRRECHRRMDRRAGV